MKLLNNWDINAIPLNISTDPAVLQQIFQASQNFRPYHAVRRHPALLQLWPQHLPRGDSPDGEALLSRVLPERVLHVLETINDVDSDGGGSGITFYNRRLEKGRANYDTTHRFVSVFIAQLPFGKGRKYLQSGLRTKILGGWDFMYSHTLQTGVPVSITFAGSPFNYLPGTRRANQVLPNDQAKSDGWEHRAQPVPDRRAEPASQYRRFRYPAAFTAGTLGRNTITGTWINWVQTLALQGIPHSGERAEVHPSRGI